MTERKQGLAGLWSGVRPLIGMVHLLPLPGAPRWKGSMDAVVERARMDAEALAGAGFDGIIVENFLDAPFYAGSVPAETVAAITRAVLAVRDITAVPVGVNVLRNDSAAALGIAAATGARFIRVNVHTGSMWTDQGLIEGRAHETLRLRRHLAPEVAILADVHVKHATPPAGSELASAASDAWTRGLADALVVSGSGTGRPTDLEEIRTAQGAAAEAPVLVGSGITQDNAAALLAVADGAIVGTAAMVDGRPGAGIDAQRARALVAAARG